MLPDSEAGTRGGPSSSSRLRGAGITTERGTQCFKPGPTAAVIHLSAVLVGKQGFSAPQKEFTVQFTSSKDRFLARRSIPTWIQQTRSAAGPHE